MIKPLDMYAAVARLDGLIAVKVRRGKQEIELQRKLQALFNKALREAEAKLRAQPTFAGARAIQISGAAINPETLTAMEKLVLDSVIASVDAPTAAAEELLRERAFEASRRTMANLRGNIQETLAQAVTEGLSQNQAAVLLRENFTAMADSQLRTIARTEILGAQSTTNFNARLAAGVAFSQWVTAGDDLVRDSHAELEGAIVRTGDEFDNGLKHPHDQSGPIEEWINCRCAAVPFIMPARAIAPVGMTQFFERDLMRLAA